MMVCFNLSLRYGIGAHINNLIFQGFFMVMVVLFGQRISWCGFYYLFYIKKFNQEKKSLK